MRSSLLLHLSQRLEDSVQLFRRKLLHYHRIRALCETMSCISIDETVGEHVHCQCVNSMIWTQLFKQI